MEDQVCQVSLTEKGRFYLKLMDVFKESGIDYLNQWQVEAVWRAVEEWREDYERSSDQ